MNDTSKAHFKELTAQEKLSKLSFVASQKIKFLIWKKGEKNRLEVQADLFLNEKFHLVLKEFFIEETSRESYLYNFSINGVSFFGKAKLFVHDQIIVLDCNDSLFKSERRKSYRLLTFPHYKSYADIEFDLEEVSDSNLFDINTKKTQTGLFKNFLELVNEDTARSGQVLSFRVFDISATGIGLLFGKPEKEVLERNIVLSDMKITLSGHEVLIPKSEIRYVTNMLGTLDYEFKAGIEFKSVDTNLDNDLGYIINKFLRDTDAQFEDFVE